MKKFFKNNQTPRYKRKQDFAQINRLMKSWRYNFPKSPNKPRYDYDEAEEAKEAIKSIKKNVK